MKSRIKHILVLLCLMAAIVCHGIPSRPNPQRLVNDLAGLFTPAQAFDLERVLVAFDDTTSNQITVVTVKDLEGYAASEYATRIGIDWQVGSSEFNNGIVLLVKPKTTDSSGQVFIAVGYGLEGAIPDAYAKRIIENVLIPHFRNNDYFGGVTAACDVLMKLASGEISDPRDMDDEDIELIMSIFFISLLFLAITIIVLKSHDGNNSGPKGGNRGRTIYIGPVITTGRSYGSGFGGGSFGGGFGGGFGGFGGGSFGGGGAGGSW